MMEGTPYSDLVEHSYKQYKELKVLKAQLAEANEKLVQAEAERVNVFVRNAFWSDFYTNKQRVLEDEETLILCDAFDYLRDHNIIKEAE